MALSVVITGTVKGAQPSFQRHSNIPIAPEHIAAQAADAARVGAAMIHLHLRGANRGPSWSAFGIPRRQFPIVKARTDLGGQVRVGSKDNLYPAKDVVGSDHAALVAKAVIIDEAKAQRVATAAKARARLGLSTRWWP